MKTITISNDPAIKNLQVAFAITEAKLKQAPLLMGRINRDITDKQQRLKELDEKDTSISFDTTFFLSESLEVESLSDKSQEIDKLNQEIESLTKIHHTIKDQLKLTQEAQDKVREKLFKSNAGLKEYAVAIDIGKYTKHHPFTNDEHMVNVGEFKSKLSEIFGKYNFGDEISAHTTISKSDVDENEVLKEREYIEDAFYFHFPEQLMGKVEQALAEFMEYCIEHTLEKRFADRENEASHSLYEMMHEVTSSSKEELDDKIKESFRAEIERDLSYSVTAFQRKIGLTLPLESRVSDLSKKITNTMKDTLKPDFKEHFPNESSTYLEWSENSFGGNSGIDKTQRGYEAARLLSIESYISENPKEVALAKTYLSKLEKSLSKERPNTQSYEHN